MGEMDRDEMVQTGRWGEEKGHTGVAKVLNPPGACFLKNDVDRLCNTPIRYRPTTSHQLIYHLKSWRRTSTQGITHLQSVPRIREIGDIQH